MSKPSTAVDANVILIRETMKKQGVSIKILAKRIGVTRQYLSGILNGHLPLTAANLQKIADVLDVSTQSLLTTTGKLFRNRIEQILLQTSLNDIELDAQIRDLTELTDLAVRFGVIDTTSSNDEVNAIKDWRNPDLYPFKSEKQREVREYIQSGEYPVICVDGATRVAKTLFLLEQVFNLHFEHRGLRSLVCRSNSVDLNDSIRYDIRETLLKYDLDDPLSPIDARGGGGSRRFTHLKINGGEMVVTGLSRPGAKLGTEFDVILYSQSEQSTEEQFQKLITRNLGTSGKMGFNEKGNPKHLFLMDANPDRSDHYLKRYEQDGKIKFVSFGFDDNPLYNRGGERTPLGINFISELDENLEGVYHDRFFKGLWTSPEGAVFEILDDKHIISELPTDFSTAYRFYRGIDFGSTAPSVCLWIAEHKQTQDVLVFREWRHTHKTILEIGNEVKHHTKESITNTIIDNDEHHKDMLLKHCQIPTEMARKGAGSVNDGVMLIQNALANARDGKDGGLRFYDGLRCNADSELVRNNKPLSVITEIRDYIWDENKDKPVKRNDHGIDIIRYFYLWREDRKSAVGFGSAAVNKKQVI